jgi:hypothetical protein
MDYQRIYNQIVDRAKQEERKKGNGTYYESHHILPKCLGGSNKKENLVLLTGREHFLVHWMLVRIYPENKSLVHAFWAMCNRKGKGQEERYSSSSRGYAEAKLRFSELRSKTLTSFYQTPEGQVFFENRHKNMDYVSNNKKRIANTDWTALSKKLWRSLLQFSQDGILIKEWPSGIEASKSLGIQGSNIASCCRGRLKTAGGFIWKYKIE